MDDPVSFPEILDLAPYMAPNRNDYKTAHTPTGPRAPYMDWATPDQGPVTEPVYYRLYGQWILFSSQHVSGKHVLIIAAVVVHLGTMIGGHYIAYCLVDPEKVFGDKPMPTDLEVDGGGKYEDCEPKPLNEAEQQHRRVWCFCSE